MESLKAKNILIEEFLNGEEMSFFTIQGKHLKILILLRSQKGFGGR